MGPSRGGTVQGRLLMKRQIGSDEREIRDGIVDVLAFLASRTATPEQVREIKRRIMETVNTFHKAQVGEAKA
jgi:hypothetical protein